LPSLRETRTEVQQVHSTTLRRPFDNAESGLSGHERHVEGYYWLGQPFQGQRSPFFELNGLLDRYRDPLSDKDLVSGSAEV
jgi:hypothetical protein